MRTIIEGILRARRPFHGRQRPIGFSLGSYRRNLPRAPLVPLPFAALILCLLPGGLSAGTDTGVQLAVDTGGHKGVIRELIFTPPNDQGSQRLISISEDKTIRIWDVDSAAARRTLRGEMGAGDEGRLFAGALSPDGRWLAVGGHTKNDKIRLIDLAGSADAPVRLLAGHGNVVLSLAFSPERPTGKQYLLSGSSDDTAHLWDVESGESLAVLRGHTGAINAVAFSPDGERLVTGSNDHTLRLWMVPKEKQQTAPELLAELTGHTDKVRTVAFSPDGGHLFSGSDDKTIRLWDGRDGSFIKELAKQESGIGSLSLSLDGTKLLTGIGPSGMDPGMNHYVFSIPDGKRLLRFDEHRNLILATAISPDGLLAATGGGGDDGNGIILRELATGQVRHTLVGKGGTIWSVGFARDGTGIAWGREPKTGNRVFYDTPLQHRFQLGPDSRHFEPAWGGRVGNEGAGDRQYLRGLSQAGDIRVRTADDPDDNHSHSTLEILQKGKVLHRIKLGPAGGYGHRSLTLTPDGHTVISGAGNGHLASFDVASGRKRNDFIGHTGDVWAIAPSPDGRWLVSGSADQTVRLWEIATGKPLLTLFPTLDGANGNANSNEWVAWTPEGYYTTSFNGGRLLGWHSNQGEERLARYYRADRFAGRFRKPRVVAHYLATGGDLDQAIELANAETAAIAPGHKPVKRTDSAELPALFPPMVSIEKPNPPQFTTSRPHLELTIEARSVNKEPVREMWVTVNGRRPGQDARKRFKKGARRTRWKLKLALDPGENRIAVYGKNRHSQSEPVMRFVTREIPEGQTPVDKPGLYLLAIGASHDGKDAGQDPGHDSGHDFGQDGGKPDLAFEHAGDDANAVARLFASQQGRLYREVKTRVLTGKAANRDGVIQGLGWLRQESTRQDVSVIFIAGHGIEDNRGNYYFLPPEGDPKRLEETGIAWRALQDTLAELPGARWLLADTCHPGTGTGTEAGRRVRGSADITDALRGLGEVAPGVVVMSAATGREVGLEDAEWEHGAFIRALMDGWEGHADLSPQDNRIDIRELARYITRRVAQSTRGQRHLMTRIPETAPNFPVALINQ
ncbi:MAG: WD40 repeat [Candidatus Kentron sp. G]|nr:MAG: WD40 repeat [Candidatus Kentron sp. G]VFM99570.1 MAG: WD40 repeat [Candidatus Kentron sp. G]VFN01278.1 MAG: WD40 repeat [Candidatus Kentron sp. G]